MTWSLSDWLRDSQRKVEIMRRWRQAIQTAPDELLFYTNPESLAQAQDLLWSLLLDAAGEQPVTLEVSLDWSQLADLTTLVEALRGCLFDLLAEDDSQRLVAHWPRVQSALAWVLLALRQERVARVFALGAEKTHLESLDAISRELAASIDLSYVLQKIINYITEVAGADSGAILIFDQTLAQVVPRAGVEWRGEALAAEKLPPAWLQGRGVMLVLRAGEPLENGFLADLNTEAKVIVAAPLNANGQFHGLLALTMTRSSGFNDGQRRLIHSAADRVAASVGNAEVYRFLNDQARELGLILRQQQEESSKRQAILASIADGVVVNDVRGKIILVNPAAERILGVSAQDLLGDDPRRLLELFTAGQRENTLRAMTALLTNGEVGIESTAEATLEIHNRTVSARLAPVQGGRGDFMGVVTIFRDITKEVEADRAKSEFVSTVSHELRTPMTAIKGYTDLLSSEMVGALTEEQKHFLGIIQKNTARLTALINDLLDISRIEAGRVRFEPRMLQIGEIVRDVCEAFAGQVQEKEHSLAYTLQHGLPSVLGDADRLTQVLTNLLGNAIHYTPQGGKIHVSVYQMEDTLRVDVSDNGIGIPGDQASHIFDRFYRVDHPVVQQVPGTGLGLPISKMFVEMHGGRLWVESEPGVGSTFTIILPLPLKAEQEETVAEIWLDKATQLTQQTILVIDSDYDVVELVRLYLERAGYQCAQAELGQEALERIGQIHPDMVLLEASLPDVDGLDVLKTIKNDPNTADIPVLMFSVVPDDGSLLELGSAGYLTKPVDESELLAQVRSVLARRARILVVEDDEDTVEMLQMTLRRVGFSVQVALNGYDAMSVARSWSPQVILLDLRLPGMDGYEVLTHLKRDFDTQDIPVVAISAHISYSEAEAQQLTEMGAAVFVTKPFSVAHLIEKLDMVL